jgi:nucleoside 2-deoxyribosyltransferase
MPFAEKFDEIYEYGIKLTVNRLGMYCERVDEIVSIDDDNILAQIYGGIKRADFIIADMTDKNPNVFYEVGYAHALGKRVILLTQEKEDIPFNLNQRNHIIYEGKIKILSTKLEKRLRALII